MAKTLVSVRLDDELLRMIDELAEKEGVTRTEIMESALARGVEGERLFVESLEKPFERMMMQVLTSKVLRPVIEAIADRKISQHRVELAQKGLKKRGKPIVRSE